MVTGVEEDRVRSIIQHLIVAFLVVALPVWDRYEVRRLKASTNPRRRIESYQLTIAWLWITTIVLLVSTPLLDLVTPLPTPGLAVPRSTVFLVLGSLGVGALVPLVMARWKPEDAQKRLQALGDTLLILPRTTTERWWFAGVALSAGICEEIIFRGFLIRYFAALPIGLGLPGAVLLAALIFGIAHGYQGIVGVLVTGILALVMTALFYATGSLVVPIVVHALLDLRVLLMRVGGDGVGTE
jgi:membrane protease YdiL (CAAX protease family)